jgi:hypothetical protein
MPTQSGAGGDVASALAMSLSSPHRKFGTISSAIRIASAFALRPGSTATLCSSVMDAISRFAASMRPFCDAA